MLLWVLYQAVIYLPLIMNSYILFWKENIKNISSKIDRSVHVSKCHQWWWITASITELLIASCFQISYALFNYLHHQGLPCLYLHGFMTVTMQQEALLFWVHEKKFFQNFSFQIEVVYSPDSSKKCRGAYCLSEQLRQHVWFIDLYLESVKVPPRAFKLLARLSPWLQHRPDWNKAVVTTECPCKWQCSAHKMLAAKLRLLSCKTSQLLTLTEMFLSTRGIILYSACVLGHILPITLILGCPNCFKKSPLNITNLRN